MSLARYLRRKSAAVHCLYTDPVNAMLAQYRPLQVHQDSQRIALNDKRFGTPTNKICRVLSRRRALAGYRDEYILSCPPDTTYSERHYRIGELAAFWRIGRETARKLCMNEPGVIK